jgi:hypothetical protein
MSAPLNTYRVWITSRGCHVIFVEAESESAAKVQALYLFEDGEEDDLKLQGYSVDSVEVDLVGPATEQSPTLEQGGAA